MRVNDVAEERRSRQVIQTSRTQRSHEEQRRRENRNRSIATSFVQEEKGREGIPSRYSDGRSSNRLKSLANEHELQNIAVNYEQMIKNKTEENEKCEGLLRAERKKREELEQLAKDLGDAMLEKDRVIR